MVVDLARQLTAHESLAQWCSPHGFAVLQIWITQPHPMRPFSFEPLRRNLPSLHRMVDRLYQLQTKAGTIIEELYPPAFKNLMLVVCLRIREVHITYQQQDTPAEIVTMSTTRRTDDWRRIGSQYLNNPLRRRPFYPNIRDDISRHSLAAAAMDDHQDYQPACRKMFDSYTQRRQTGGIMAFWCRHMICLGWHVIMKAEGRDDFFCALFTFFKQCPRYIIHDFACAAGA